MDFTRSDSESGRSFVPDRRQIPPRHDASDSSSQSSRADTVAIVHQAQYGNGHRETATPLLGDEEFRSILEVLESGRQWDHEVSGEGDCTEWLERTIDGYRLLRVLGHGGMGWVFEAEEMTLQRRVALKVLAGGKPATSERLTRFEIEARAIGALDHPAIVKAYQYGVHDGVPFLAMELVRGVSLRDIIRYFRFGPVGSDSADSSSTSKTQTDSSATTPASLPPLLEDAPTDSGPLVRRARAQHRFREAARMGAQVADALAHAHEQGILHRDVKPSNILVDMRGRVRLTDFGLARFDDRTTDVTRAGAVFGTLRYMSPEQIAGKEVDARTDVYSLGATLYELVCLEPLCPPGEPAQIMHTVLQESPRLPREIDPAVPKDLEAILLKATAKRREDRYGSASALADDLRRFVEGRPVRARKTNWLWRLREWSHRHRTLATVLFSVALLCLVVMGLQQWNASRLRHVNAELNRTLRQAEAERRRNADLLYASEISRAHAAIEAGNIGEAVLLLQRYTHPRSTHGTDIEWGLLRHAITRQNHDVHLVDSPLYTLAVHPRGTIVAVAGQDAVVRFCDRVSLQVQLEIATGQQEVNDVAFSSDGRKIVTAGDDGTVKVWNAATGTLLHRVQLSTERVTSAEFALKDRWIVAACNEPASVRIVDATDGTQVRILDESLRGVEGIAVSPDGRRVAVGGWYSRACRIYDLASGRRERTLAEGPYEFTSCSWERTPYGELLTTSNQGGEILVGPPDERPLVLRPFRRSLESVAVAHDGSQLAAAGRDGRIVLARLDAEGRYEIAPPKGQSLLWTCRLPDGTFAIAAEHAVALYDPRDERVQWTPVASTATRSLSPDEIHLGPAGRWLVAGNALFEHRGGAWHRRHQLGSKTDSATTVRFLPGGEALFVGYANGHIARLRLPDLQTTATYLSSGTAPVTTVAIDAGGAYLAAAFDDGRLALWRTNSGKLLAEAVSEHPVRSLTFCKSQTLVSAPDLTAWTWHAGQLQIVRQWAGEQPESVYGFRGSSVVLAIDPKTPSLKLIDVDNEEVQRDMPLPWNGRGLPRLDAAGSTVSFLDWKGRVCWARLERSEAGWGRSSSWHGHGNRAYAVAFAPDNRALLSAGIDGTLRNWRNPLERNILGDGRDFTLAVLCRKKPLCLLAGPTRCELWDLASKRRRKLEFPSSLASEDDVQAAAMDDNGTIALVASNQYISCWNTLNSALKWYQKSLHFSGDRHLGEERRIAFHPRRPFVALVDRGTAGARIQVWDTKDGKKLREKSWPASQGCRAAVLSPDWRWLALGEPNYVTIYDTSSRQIVARTAIEGGWQLSFAENGRRLFVLSAGGSVYDWRWYHGKPAVPWGAEQVPVESMTLSPSERTLLLITANGRLTLWQVATGQEYYSRYFGNVKYASISDAGWLALSAPNHVRLERWK